MAYNEPERNTKASDMLNSYQETRSELEGREPQSISEAEDIDYALRRVNEEIDFLHRSNRTIDTSDRELSIIGTLIRNKIRQLREEGSDNEKYINELGNMIERYEDAYILD